MKTLAIALLLTTTASAARIHVSQRGGTEELGVSVGFYAVYNTEEVLNLRNASLHVRELPSPSLVSRTQIANLYAGESTNHRSLTTYTGVVGPESWDVTVNNVESDVAIEDQWSFTSTPESVSLWRGLLDDPLETYFFSGDELISTPLYIVPEPSSLVLLGIGLLAMLRRRS